MTADNEFLDWRNRCGFSIDEAAEHLDLTKYDVTTYEIGAATIPDYVKTRMSKFERMQISLDAQRRGKNPFDTNS